MVVRGGECSQTFIPSVLWSTSSERGSRARLGAHFPCSSISFCRAILLSPVPISHVPFVLPRGRTEELEGSSQCTLPTSPEGLHYPLGFPLPSAGEGHRWRRTNTVLGVSQAWSIFTLLAHPAPARESFPGFLSL